MKKQLIGKVISTKMKGSVVVKVVRTLKHPLYQKMITKTKLYKVHIEENQQNVKTGDMVLIEETRPISKEIRFRLLNKAVKNN